MFFGADSVILSLNPDDVIASDCKKYDEGGVAFSVSQIEELDFANFNAKKEEIRRAILRHKARKIPIAVSMGNLAASGGYWVSTPADRIFAAPETISAVST